MGTRSEIVEAAAGSGHEWAEAMAAAVLEALAADSRALARLRVLLSVPAAPAMIVPPAYTAESLGEAIGISPKAIRNAIARRELQAVKRGGRWLISREAVEAWTRSTAVEQTRPRPRRSRGATDVMSCAMARLERRTLDRP